MAATLPAQVFLVRDDDVANAHSIMDLLMLAAHQGSNITVKATGPDAESSVEAVAELIENGFGENDEDD